MRTRVINLTGSAIVAAGEAVIEGMYVVVSAPIRLWHDPATTQDTGMILNASLFTPAVGMHTFYGMSATAGLYVAMPSGGEILFFVRNSNE